MPLTYTIDPVLRLVTFRPEQLPTLPDFARVLDDLAVDPLFRPGFSVLVDRRELSVEPDVAFVRGAIDAIAHRNAMFPGTRWASLTSHLATYGMGRMAEAFAENRGVTYRVFTNAAEAMNWLLDRPL